MWLCAAAGAAAPRVVVLHSYHQGLSWVDDINRGLREALGTGPGAPVLHYEYLDTKRHEAPAQLDAMAVVLASRYRENPPAAVVVSDNNGFEFLRARRDELFGPVPVVFCGVNGYRPEMLAGVSGFTGVAEAVSFAENLQLIARLHAGLTRLVVYGGGTPTYRINRDSLRVAAAELGTAERLEFVEGLTISAIRAHARELGRGTAILLLSVLRDDDGAPLGFGASAERLTEVAGAPVYAPWEFFLGHGPVGGRLVSGAAQGRAAGELVARILAGEPPEALPVRTDSPNPYLFDDRQLVRWGIDRRRLPPGSEVRNRPTDLYHEHREMVWGGGLAFTVLGGLVVLLVVDRHHRRRIQAETRRTRDFLQTVVDGVAEPLLVVAADHRVLLTNRAARAEGEAAAPGAHPGNGDGETCYRLSHGCDHPCDEAEHPCPLNRVLESGAPVTVTHIHPDAAGRPRHLEILASPMRDDAGRVVGMVESMRDVTERVRAFAEISRGKKEWERTFDAVPDLVCLAGPDQRIRRANRALGAAAGVAVGDLVGRPWHQVVHGGSVSPAHLAGAEQPRVEELPEDARGRVFLLSSSPLHDPAGAFLGSVHVSRDITELKRVQARLVEESERLRVTLGSIGDGVIAADPAGRISLLNPVAETLTGWSRTAALGRPLDEVYRATRTDGGGGLAPGGLRRSNSARLLSRDGQERRVRETSAPILDDRGDAAGTVLVIRDETAEQTLEEERARNQHLESLGLLAGGIAHDFNNLLMAMAANLELVAAGLPADDPLHQRLVQADTATRRATELTRQLLTFARGGEPVCRDLALGKRLRAWAEFALGGSNAGIELHLPDDLWTVSGDEGQLHQVVTNLVINARQAMPGGGTVTLACRNLEDPPPAGLPPGRYLQVEVSDTGIGIPARHLDKIFDPYFTTKSTGSGLGLATSYSIVRRHGGQLSVTSALGEGSTFRLTLPAGEGTEATEAAGCPDEAPAPAGGRVLVMDDEELLRDLVGVALEQLGYQAVLTADGEQALAAFRDAVREGRPFDALLLDLTVPGGMGGCEVVDRLRAESPGVRAIASSGYSADPVLARPRDHGFAGAVGKPYRMEDLGEVLARVLAAEAPA